MYTSASEKATMASIISNAEALVHSWFESMDSALHARMAWEFKATRQAALVNRLAAEVTAEEEKYRSACEEIDADYANLVEMH